jgi:hypothetical protein
LNITVEIPDPIAGALAGEGQDLARAVLEAVAIEGYRSDRLSEYEVQKLLGFEYCGQVHDFFKQHGVDPLYSIADLEHDIAEASRYPLLPKAR